MGKIRFLHISDLHYDKDKRNIKEICSAFFNDINMVKKEYPIDFILFSISPRWPHSSGASTCIYT